MGTASQTMRDPEDQRAFKKMISDVKKNKTAANRRSLQRAIAQAIRQVITKDPHVKEVVSLAVQEKVKKDVLDRYVKWKERGGKSGEWPFKRFIKK